MSDDDACQGGTAAPVIPLRAPRKPRDVHAMPASRGEVGAEVTDFRQARLDRKRPRKKGDGSADRDDRLREMNERYAVVREGGRTAVLYFDPPKEDGQGRQVDGERARPMPTFMSFKAFADFHSNERVRVPGDDEEDGDKYVPLGRWWLNNRHRKQYDGLCFEPGAGEVIDGRLNLWGGWGIQPAPGDWRRMERHIREVLAAGDKAAADYIIRWCAWAVQNPGRRAEAALVFKGNQGTGKGTLGNALCRIFGQHSIHISSAEQLAGRFSGHLRDACFLFADEAYWPGDKAGEGTLKRLITEPDLFVESKGRDGVQVRNTLHVVMASNDKWIVPAGENERRYAVFDVSEHRRQDPTWFKPLHDEMLAGGDAAMLHDLLAMDLGTWHPRQIVRTRALREQQSRNLSPDDAWWVQLLETGSLAGADPREPNRAISNGYEERVDTLTGRETRRVKGLFDQAREVSPRLRGATDHHLGDILRERGCFNDRKVMRRQGWTFPSLVEARRQWEQRYPGWEWGNAELYEWWIAGG